MADDYGMYLGGGYGYLPYINDAYRLGMEGEQQNITRYGQYGTVPVVVNPDFDYFTTIQKAVDEYKARNPNYPRDERGLMRKDVWSQIAASVTDLSPEVWQKQYDISSGILSRQGRMQTPEEFNTAIGQAANMGTPTLAKQAQQAALTGYTTDQNGNIIPTMAREQYQTNTGLQTAQLLANLRGPENYFQYANALRGLQDSPMLGYAQQLGQPGGSAGFNAWGQSQPATLQGLVGGQQPGIPAPAAQVPAATSQIPTPGTGQRGIGLTLQPQGQQGTGLATMGSAQQSAQQAGTIPTPAGQPSAFVQPHKANVRQMLNWSPTEQKMWSSSLEARGYDPSDWFAAAKRAAPKGQAAGSTTWR